MLKTTLLAACLVVSGSVWADDTAPKKAPAAKSAPKAATCLQTGSRIPRKDGQCVNFGRVYTREDLNRTGRFDNAQALKALDPAL